MRDAEYYRAEARFCEELAEAMKRPDYKERCKSQAHAPRNIQVGDLIFRHNALMVRVCMPE